MSARHVLASNLRKLLVSHGISSQTAAARAGMKGSQFSNYLNAKGPKGPSVEVLDRLAEAFHTTPAALLDEGREAPSVIIRDVEHPIEVCALRWAKATLQDPKVLLAVLESLPRDMAEKAIRTALAKTAAQKESKG